MRVGVLEWVSCAGRGLDAVFGDSLRREGWAMCRAALTSLAHAGYCPVAAVTDVPAEDVERVRKQNPRVELVCRSDAISPRAWREVYSACDITLVIAPESHGILASTLKWCDKHGVRTCNAHGDFLVRSSDKLATAFHLERHRIPHPPTCSLARATTDWLRKTAIDRARRGEEDIWIVKQRGGAGCDGMSRMTSDGVRRFRQRMPTSRLRKGWIVQPWLSGESFSRAAIFDADGNPHWLPVTRQHLAVTDCLSYSGGAIEPDLAAQMPGMDELLARTIAALGTSRRGWIGIDFLYDASSRDRPLTIIEINPRLTTSFVGLCQAGAPGLAGAIVAGCLGRPVELPDRWQSVGFTAGGEITRGVLPGPGCV